MHQHSNYRHPRKKREKGSEKIIERLIIFKNVHNIRKEIVNQVQEVQRVLQKINTRTNMLRHILIKLKKYQTQGKTIKSSKGKAESNIQGKLHTTNSWSLIRNSADQKGIAGYI